MLRPVSPAEARVAAGSASVGFLFVAVLHVLLAFGVLPITMAWGGTQSVLSTRLRLASLAAAGTMGLFAYVIRRRVALHPTRVIKAMTWVISAQLVLNTIGNFASRSVVEAVVFGPLSLALALLSLLVAASGEPVTMEEARG